MTLSKISHKCSENSDFKKYLYYWNDHDIVIKGIRKELSFHTMSHKTIRLQ